MNAAELIEIETPKMQVIQPVGGAVVQTPMQLLTHAVQSGASVETMEKLMALHERWEANQARRAFDAAMAAAKARIPVIVKNRTVGYDHKGGGGQTSYRHEDLGEIARTVDPILAEHGLSYRFQTTSNPNEPVTVTCIVSHRDGYSERNTLSAGRDDSGKKNSIQAIGSTITYLQRYTLKAALGLSAAADDDGKAASDAPKADTISDDQIAELQAMIDDLGGADPAKFKAQFLRWAGVETLADIPAKNFGDAVAGLQQSRRKA